MHNLELSEEQVMILETVRKLVTDIAAPNALEHDEHAQFVRPTFDALAELGLLGMAVEEKHGGAGLGMLALVVALEEVARGCGSSARVLLSQGGLCGMALAGLPGAEAALGELLVGASLGAFIGPEHGVTAKKDGEGYRLDGACECATAAAEAARLVIVAMLEGSPALFLVPADRARIEPIVPLGYRASAPGRVTLSSTPVDASMLLASGDLATKATESAQLAAWIGGAAIATGSALASVELSRRHTEERVAFGKPLARQQAVGHKLVEGLRRAHAARHLTWHAARLFDLGQDARGTALMAKLSAVDAALLAADEGIQVHGGYGFTVEYHVERHYRDAKTLEVLDGGASSLRDALTASLDAH